MELDRVSWAELEPAFIGTWGWPNGKYEGEHMCIVGPTGSGKSMFQNHIIKRRADSRGSYVYILATKPADKEMKKLGWPIVNTWPPPWDKRKQVIFWPKITGMLDGSQEKQKYDIVQFLDQIWQEDANCILVFDEIAYLEDELRLGRIINRYWREARTQHISIVAGTQRPRNVSRNMWSQTTFAVGFKPDDEDDAIRTAEILGSRKEFKDQLMALKRHEFIIVEKRNHEAYISKLGT